MITRDADSKEPSHNSFRGEAIPEGLLRSHPLEEKASQKVKITPGQVDHPEASHTAEPH